MLRFDGRVVVVTGAGGGLGREYALTFAERGAAVVVNDLGGSAHGEGRGSSMADKVVAEIRARGGKAVANYDSVENGEKIIQTAIDNYGRVDVVVNNAGILRDKSLQNMTDMDWDLIHRVHLKGSYSVTKAAWPHMKRQQFGRVIMTSSNAGIYGNFGQANYSAAKLGLIGLSNAVAIEGAKNNVFSNAIIPTAGSRLTQTVMTQELVEALRPELVAPLVVWLCHESCPENGGVFEAAVGWFGRLEWVRSRGVVLGQSPTPEQLRDAWAAATDMKDARHFSSMQEVTAELMSVMQGEGDKTVKKPSTATTPKEFVFEPMKMSYTAKDTVLYALGVGASGLKHVYESSEDFQVLPTFAVVPGLGCTSQLVTGEVPGLKVDLSRLLHGEQYLEIYTPFPAEATLITETKIAEVLDKGSGACVLMDVETKDAATGKKIAYGQYSIFLLGEGGFGGPRTSPAEKKTVPHPERAPDAVVEQKTSPDQAKLYRLGSGDNNPLHMDPTFAKMAGFKQPILHGLCSFGHSVRHVLDTYAGGDVGKFFAAKARFAKPVLPGHTLVTEMWKAGDRIHFQTKVKETGETAISGAYVQLKAGSAGSSGGDGGSTGGSPTGSAPGLKSRPIFEEIGKRLKAQPGLAKTIQAVYLYVITKGGKEAGNWTIDLKNGDGAVYEGSSKQGAPNVTITIDDEDMVQMVTGKLNPQQAFLSGKLKVKGNIMLTQKLQNLLKDQSKL